MGNSSRQSIPVIKSVRLSTGSGRLVIVFSNLYLTNRAAWSATRLLLRARWGRWTRGVSGERAVEWKLWPRWEFPLKTKPLRGHL